MSRQDVINSSILNRQEENEQHLNEIRERIEFGRKASELNNNIGWNFLKKAIEEKIEIAKDSLITCSPEKVGGLQGGVQSLKWVLNLVKTWGEDGLDAQEELLNLQKQ